MPQWATTLAAARKRHLLSQQELAELAGCARRSITALESGKATARLDLLVRVARVLGLEMDLKARGGAPT